MDAQDIFIIWKNSILSQQTQNTDTNKKVHRIAMNLSSFEKLCDFCIWYLSSVDLTLIPAWISNHMPSKMWDEITYPFLNFNGCTVEV